MRKLGLKFTLLLTMLFVSQTVLASSVPCISMGTGSNMDMDSAHAGHTMESGSSSTIESNCCGGGYCSVSSCVSPVVLADTAIASGDTAPTRLWLDAVVCSPSHFANLAFRPPIYS